jgi:hypothetical protein
MKRNIFPTLPNLLFILSILFLQSCISIQLSGYNSGYKKLSTDQKSRVVVLEQKSSIRQLSNSDTIYKIKADQLLEFMASEDSVLVHFWSPNCSAPLCYPLDYVHKAYASTGYTLIIIADYFDMEVINGQSIEGLQYPLFAVNGEYYDTDICYKYHERFVADLLKQDKKNIEKFTLYTRHMLFSKGKLVSTSPTKVLKKGT